MSSLSVEQRSQLLQWITGYRRIPPGSVEMDFMGIWWRVRLWYFFLFAVHWKWPFIDDLPIKHGDCHSELLPEDGYGWIIQKVNQMIFVFFQKNIRPLGVSIAFSQATCWRNGGSNDQTPFQESFRSVLKESSASVDEVLLQHHV